MMAGTRPTVDRWYGLLIPFPVLIWASWANHDGGAAIFIFGCVSIFFLEFLSFACIINIVPDIAMIYVIDPDPSTRFVVFTSWVLMPRSRDVGAVWIATKAGHAKNLACPWNLVVVWVITKYLARPATRVAPCAFFANMRARRGRAKAAPKY